MDRSVIGAGVRAWVVSLWRVALVMSLLVAVAGACSGGGAVVGGRLSPTPTPSPFQEFCSLITLVDGDDRDTDPVAEYRVITEVRATLPDDAPPRVVEYLDGVHEMGERLMSGEPVTAELLVSLANYDASELDAYVAAKCS